MNSIYFGDNLPILKSLADESVDLIYIDPPFNTGKIQKHTRIKTVKSKNGSRRGFQGNTYETIELGTRAYQDSFNSTDSNFGNSDAEKAYLDLAPEASIYFLETFLRPRIEEAYRILQPHGSLYFHIDYREVHYCKLLLDRIFGRESFLNEIIWAYDYGGRARSKWSAKHDNILFYAKDPKHYIFNSHEVDKEPYMAPGLVGPKKLEQGKMPTDTWWARFSGTNRSISASDTWWLHFAKEQDEMPVLRGQPKGQNDTWWQTIIPTGSKERLGYPTQKPRILMDRIIKASSSEGATVLDFFAGSGTVGESCLRLGRSFILIDNNKSALEVMAKRFAGLTDIEWNRFDPTPYAMNKEELETQTVSSPKPKLSQEFVMLASVANYLQGDLEESNDLWINSPFEWILKLPPRKKGKLGGDLIASWLASKGILPESTREAGETIQINGLRFATKFSTLWTSGSYKFQQIRSKGYDYVICLGISPFDAHCWVFERQYAVKNGKPQHKSGKVADYWIELNPKKPDEWTTNSGGSLDQAYRIIKRLLKK
jgi:site-specific DNA-methyltransferase (adenine-specific)